MKTHEQQQHALTTEVFPNRSCCDIGHAWQSTTSDTYRRCTRAHCHAAEHLVEGRWVPVPRRNCTKRAPGAQQPSLFS